MSQDQLMPWESGDAPGLSESEATDSMFDALGPEFDDEGQPERDEQPDPEDDQGELPDDEFEGEEPEDEEFEDEEGLEDDEEEGDDESDVATVEIEINGEKQRIPADAKVPVKIDGEIQMVPIGEAGEGYSRTQDYTRKTQELAQERNERLQHLDQVRSQYVERLGQAEQFIQASLPQRPSDQLRKENPGEYAAQMEEWRDHVGQFQAVQAERQRAIQEQQQQYALQEQQRLAEEQQRLVKAVPEWKDDSARQEGLTELQGYLQNEYGYTDQELAGVDDHRALLIAKKAAAYDKMMSEGDEKLKKAPSQQDKPLEPGSRKRKAPSKTAKKKAQRAKNRLKQTGSVDDAAAALLASGAFDD